MIESSNFREINEIEKEIIFQTLSTISPNFSQFMIRSKNILYISFKELNSKTNYPNTFLVSNLFQENLGLIKLNSKIHSLGLYFGFFKRRRFYLSLEGAEFLYKKGMLSAIKFLNVNKKGEKSILYGNNILKNMILKIPSNIQKEDYLLIFNEIDEILALAQSKVESKNIKQLNPEDLVAFNLSDKGIYLRETQ